MIFIALLHSTIRKEEKLIIEAAQNCGVPIKLIDIRDEIFDPQTFRPEFDIALQRAVSTVKGAYAAAFLEAQGIPVVNSHRVTQVCQDKFLTSLILAQAGVPTVKFAMFFTVGQALRAVEEMGGFPVVIKPPLGSWGRLLAKVNDFDSLEALIEHKDVLGSPQHKAFYIQKYVEKQGRDIRAFLVDGEPLCAIYRESPHWITNTARGAVTRNCPISAELRDIAGAVSKAIGDGLLAVDLFETAEGLRVNEVNHTMEFRNSEEPTGISISGAVIEYCLRKAAQG